MIVMKLLLFCVFTVVPNVSTESSANTASKTVPDNETPSRDRVFEDCFEARQYGQHASGIYRVKPKSLNEAMPFYVYCDQETDGGGWLVFQRRQDGSFDFYRSWAAYKQGFGRLGGEMWLGNEKIFQLTSQTRYELRVDMRDDENVNKYAVYDNFFITDEFNGYKLFTGSYNGDAGDSLSVHNEQTFKAKDRDSSPHKCTTSYKGGWWYTACHQANLNGLYLNGNHTSYANGVNWLRFRGYHNSLVFTEMKIRPFSQ